MGKFHKGMRFRNRTELRVEGIITFGAPFSGHFDGVLPAGEVLRLDYEPAEQFTGMWLVPERYVEFERIFIPEETRKSSVYSGYGVGCSYDQIGSDYEIVDEKPVV